MNVKIVLMMCCLVISQNLIAQSAPVSMLLPFQQDFGISAFNITPSGIAVWNGLSGTTVNSQAIAAASIPTGNANLIARTSPTTTGGAYGLATLSNARIYIQSSSNSVEGVNQVVVGFHSGLANRVRISFDIEVIEAGSGRSLGSVVQYRAGNSGTWTTIENSDHIYNNTSLNAGDVDVNGDVDGYTWIVNSLMPNTDYQLRIAHWRSGSAGSSVGLAYDNIHILPLPNVYDITGGGQYCEGGNGVNVKLSNSQQGIWYQLLHNGNNSGNPLEGNGGELDFGLQDNEGVYTAHAYFFGGESLPMNGEVFVGVQQPPSTSNAGEDQVICNQAEAFLQANEPLQGVGYWVQVSGPTADFSDLLSAQASISNLSPGNYSFSWVIEYGVCPPSTDNINILVLSPPTASYAGDDFKTCVNQVQLSGNIAYSGQGRWTKVSGPGEVVFANEYANNSNVSFAVPGTYVFSWNISNGICVTSSDEVQVIFNKAPELLSDVPVQQTKYYGENINPVVIKVTDVDDDENELQLSLSYSLNSGPIVNGLPGNLIIELVPAISEEKEWKVINSAAQNHPQAGTYEIYIKIIDDCNAEETAVIRLEILPANVIPLADAFYTGPCFFWSSNSKTATLTLAATLMNVAGAAGDIRTARVSFCIRDGNNLIPITGAQQLPVGLVNQNDLSLGSASAVVQYNLGVSNVNLLNIAVVVSGNYLANDVAKDKTITVAVPLPGGQICGGINILNVQSQGIIAGAAGWETNAGFFVQYNSSLKNPQGKVEIKLLSFHDRYGNTGTAIKTYVIRTNSIANLSINNASAQFSAKANLSEIIDGIEEEIEGNCILSLKLVDGDHASPNQNDQVAVTLFRNKGGIWYAGNWNGSTSQLQNIWSGNLSVANGIAAQKLPGNSTEQVIQTGLQVSVFPNPSAGSFAVKYNSGNSRDPVMITITDLLGRIVLSTKHEFYNNRIETGEVLKKGIYILRVTQGFEVQRVVIVKQ